MWALPKLMIVWLAALAILAAFASANSALMSTRPDQACWTTDEDSETTYLAPHDVDCLPDDTTCGIREGEYIISLRPSYQKSAHLFYLSSHVPASTLRNTSMSWYRYSDSYIIKNLQDTEMQIIRRDPGIEEVYQNHWFQVDIGWDLRCRNPRLTEEGKKICYGELEVGWCRMQWLNDKQSTKCLEELCRMEGLKLTEEQSELCEEQNYQAERWFLVRDDW